MEEKIYTLNIRQTGKFQYEAIVPEIGVTKMAPTLDSALNITLHDILKHLMTRYLILVFADQHIDRDGSSVDPQEHLKADLEYQAAFEVAQQGIALQVKRSERHLVFALSRSLTREQATWLDEHVGKLFDGYYIKDELEVELDALQKAEAHE